MSQWGGSAHADAEDSLISWSEIQDVELVIVRRMQEFAIGAHPSVFHGTGYGVIMRVTYEKVPTKYQLLMGASQVDHCLVHVSQRLEPGVRRVPLSPLPRVFSRAYVRIRRARRRRAPGSPS